MVLPSHFRLSFRIWPVGNSGMIEEIEVRLLAQVLKEDWIGRKDWLHAA